MVSIDFVSDSQHMKLYDYVEKYRKKEENYQLYHD